MRRSSERRAAVRRRLPWGSSSSFCCRGSRRSWSIARGICASMPARGWALRDGLDGDLAERAEQLRRHVDVALYTPRRPDGRPLSIAAVPAGLGALPDLERRQAARFAASALAGMMNYSNRKPDQSLLAILGRAIDLLSQEHPQDPVPMESLLSFIGDQDTSSRRRGRPARCQALRQAGPGPGDTTAQSR